MSTSDNITVNVTESFDGSKHEGVRIAFHVIIIAVQVFIMISMGAIITIQDILTHLKRPYGIFIALASQFVAMPASSFGIVTLAKLPSTEALAAIILACCPGGSASNLFTYFCDGDVPLSIMLTTISTILALGFMPLNMWIYSRKWTEASDVKVPYEGIAITLAWILIPLSFGMAAKRFIPRFANIINRIGSVLGMTFIWIGIVLQYILYPEAFNKGWKLWLIAAAIPSAGFAVGFILSLIFRQPPKQRRTIAIETGMQSISLATTIVVTSFPLHMHGQMTPLLTMCGIYLNGSGFLLALLIRVKGLFKKKSIKITPVITLPEKQITTIT